LSIPAMEQGQCSRAEGTFGDYIGHWAVCCIVDRTKFVVDESFGGDAASVRIGKSPQLPSVEVTRLENTHTYSDGVNITVSAPDSAIAITPQCLPLKCTSHYHTLTIPTNQQCHPTSTTQ
jgi:hypothetical protein